MISPATSGLITTWTTGWILPLASTTSVRLRRATFSVWTAMTTSRLRSVAPAIKPSTTTPMTEKTMIFLRLDDLAMVQRIGKWTTCGGFCHGKSGEHFEREERDANKGDAN